MHHFPHPFINTAQVYATAANATTLPPTAPRNYRTIIGLRFPCFRPAQTTNAAPGDSPERHLQSSALWTFYFPCAGAGVAAGAVGAGAALVGAGVAGVEVAGAGVAAGATGAGIPGTLGTVVPVEIGFLVVATSPRGIRNILLSSANAAMIPATHTVPFAKKSRVRREPNVDPRVEPSPPKAPLAPPPLLG